MCVFLLTSMNTVGNNEGVATGGGGVYKTPPNCFCNDIIKCQPSKFST